MTSSSSSSSSSKQLWEHLQDQQEPFALDIHLSERRIMLSHHHHPERRPRCNLRKRRIFNTRKILKLIFYKFLCATKHTHKAHKSDLISKTVKKLWQIGGRNRYSHGDSSKCAIKDSAQLENQSSVLARTSQSHKHSSFIKQEVATDSNLQWECKEENKQFCPGSLLNEASPSNKEHHFLVKDASTSSTILTKNAEEDSIFSAFLWELLVKPMIEKQNQSRFMELQGIICPSLSELLKDKRVLQNTKQLIFDCINEATERQGRKFNQEFIGLEELGKIITKKICSRGNQNATQNANFDVTSIVAEWDDMQQLNRKIAIEIGDAIIDEIIQELVGLFL